MYITIILSLLFMFSICYFLTSRSKLAVLKLKDDEIERTYKPASIEEKRLLNLSKEYRALQSSYQENLILLRKSESRLSQYYLGVGTTDSISYSYLTTGRSIKGIENKLQDVKASLKALVSEKKACVCNMGNDVVVNNKKSEAKKLFNREIKLRLRCLDNEFKAAAALVDWNNINRLIERTKITFNEINATGEIVKTYLKEQYLHLKIEELRLSYELNQLKKELKEADREEARIKREAEREEARIKAAAEKAEKDRIMMEKLVAEELSKLESSTQEQKELYELHKRELEVLRAKERRAISLAQLTRSGYVYLISNELSFGKGVYKIGMTRRADPNERVKELGDASVPELFDVHAFVYAEDAVKLEKYLHNAFSENRVNSVNSRKEFFTVALHEILIKLDGYGEAIEIDKFDVESKAYTKNTTHGTPVLSLPMADTARETAIENLSEKNTDQGKQHNQQNVPKAENHKINTRPEFDLILNQATINSSNTSKKSCSEGIGNIKKVVASEHPYNNNMQQYEYEKQVEAQVYYQYSDTNIPHDAPTLNLPKEDAIKEATIANSTVINSSNSPTINGTDYIVNIKEFAAREFPNDTNMQLHVYEEQLESKEFMVNATQKELKAFAIKKYPDDYAMQQYVYEEQLESKEFMVNATQKELKTFAIKKYPDDYAMQQYVYEEQVESKEFMVNATQKDLKTIAIKQYPDDYAMQQYTYEEQLESKEFMVNATQKELKTIAIKQYPDDYAMQQYTYEEQLESKEFSI